MGDNIGIQTPTLCAAEVGEVAGQSWAIAIRQAFPITSNGN